MLTLTTNLRWFYYFKGVCITTDLVETSRILSQVSQILSACMFLIYQRLTLFTNIFKRFLNNNELTGIVPDFFGSLVKLSVVFLSFDINDINWEYEIRTVGENYFSGFQSIKVETMARHYHGYPSEPEWVLFWIVAL